MSDLIQAKQESLIQYLKGKDLSLDLPKPFEQDIFLFESHVAGTSYIDDIDTIEPLLQDGDKLTFYREPTNPHDPQAIRIETVDGKKIGYVPRADNVIFSRLMDAGKVLFGIIQKKNKMESWLKIDIEIYLHDN